MVHSDSGWTRGVQIKLWDPLRTRAIPERLRGTFTTRRYTNPRLPLPLPYQKFFDGVPRGIVDSSLVRDDDGMMMVMMMLYRGHQVVVREVLAVDWLNNGKEAPAAQVNTQTHTHTQTDGQTDRQTDGQTDGQTYIHTHTDRRTDRHIHKGFQLRTYVQTYNHEQLI